LPELFLLGPCLCVIDDFYGDDDLLGLVIKLYVFQINEVPFTLNLGGEVLDLLLRLQYNSRLTWLLI